MAIALSILGIVPSASAVPSGYEQSTAASIDDQIRMRIRNLNRWLADQPFVVEGGGFTAGWLAIDGTTLMVHDWYADLELGSHRPMIASVLAVDPRLPAFRPGIDPRNPFVSCRAEPPISDHAQKCWSFENSTSEPTHIAMITFDAERDIAALLYMAIEDLIAMLHQREMALR